MILDEMEKIKILRNKMESILKKQKNIGNKEGLKLSKNFMDNEIIPYILPFMNNGKKYRIIRDKNNKKLIKIMNKVYNNIKYEFKNINYVTIKIMSSINAKLNLAENDSDIDIGIMIKGLNKNENIDIEKYTTIIQILNKIGFNFSHIFNPNNINNQYFSFVKIINGIEFEVKIRDLESSKTIIKLHDYLDNKLTNKEITLFTYVKYLLKKYKYVKAYSQFKKILYEWAFYNIKDGFIL
jgi:hypothetical protein